MASLVSIRRPIASLLTRTTAHPSPTLTVSRIASGVFTTRRLSTYLTPRSITHVSSFKSTLTVTRNTYQTVRQNSNQSTSQPLFRQYTFEDITSALPNKSLILVDVREPAELTSTGIIPTAVSVPLASQPDALFLTPDEFETRFGYSKPGVEEAAAAKSRGEQAPNVVFYCKAGVRAKAAAQLAAQAGYDTDKIGVYEGSWLDWERKGGRVEQWDGNH